MKKEACRQSQNQSADALLGPVDRMIAALVGLGAVNGAKVKLPFNGRRSIGVLKAAGWAAERLRVGPPFLNSQLTRLRKSLIASGHIAKCEKASNAELIEGLYHFCQEIRPLEERQEDDIAAAVAAENRSRSKMSPEEIIKEMVHGISGQVAG